MRAWCPTPYKEAFPNMGTANRVVRDMQRRKKRSKNNPLPQAPYQCECGSVHFADPRQVRVYQRMGRVAS